MPAARRIEEIVDLLSRIAAGDLAVRGQLSPNDDELDAVVVAINMLAEELEAVQSELESRVGERTAQLAAMNSDMARMANLNNLLAACDSSDEAYAMIAHGLASIFVGVSGTMYLCRPSRDFLQAQATWGHADGAESLMPQHCWALRRGHPHFVDSDAPSMTCQHVAERSGDLLCVPMTAQGEMVGLLHLRGDRSVGNAEPTLTPQKRQIALTIAEQVALALANIDLREQLRTQALRDPLTGLHNRRFADEWLEQELRRGDRRGATVGVVMIDLDHFKPVNDVYGHEAGDVMLQAVSLTFQQALRPGDIACRYGGEEFLLLVPDIDLPTLLKRTEAVREQVAALTVPYRDSTLPGVTMSAGVATYPLHGTSAEELVAAADRALYEAKRSGRDRVVAASSPANP